MLTLLTIAGGVALLLFAVRYLRKGLDRLFGRRLSAWMQRLGRTTPRAFVAGLGAAVVAPSSTTISVLAVQAVQAGHLGGRQTLIVMLGANITLTLMVQLIALNVETIAPVLILFGVLLFQTTRQSNIRGTGQIILGFGFLYMAIGLIKGAVAGADLGASADFRLLIDLLQGRTALLALAAAVLAMLLQSSTATIALLIGLTASGLVGLRESAAIVVGANVGLAGTTLAIGWSQLDSRRLAVANLILKLTVAALVLTLLSLPFMRLPQPDAARLPVVIAQIHTGFNVLVAALGLATSGPLTRQLERIMPSPPMGLGAGFGPKFIKTGPIGGVALALGQSLREILHVSEIVRGMLVDVWTAMRIEDEKLAREVAERDDRVDDLEAQIKRFLTRIIQEESPEEHADEQLRQLRYLSELETVGDIVDKNIAELVRKKIRVRAAFSDEGAAELEDFYTKLLENFEIADAVFQSRDRSLARQLVRHMQRLAQYEAELRDRHFARLNAGLAESLETSSIHLDFLTHLERINRSLSHVAYDVLQEAEA